MDKRQPAERAPSDAARRRLSNGRALNDKFLKIYLGTDLLSRRRTNPISPVSEGGFLDGPRQSARHGKVDLARLSASNKRRSRTAAALVCSRSKVLAASARRSSTLIFDSAINDDALATWHLLAMSAATIDRALARVREGLGRKRRRHTTHSLRRSIPIRTSADWNDPAPGFRGGPRSA